MESAVNVQQRLYLDTNGETYPITNFFDQDGDECSPDEAVTAVAGRDDCWFSIVLADFEGTLKQ